MNSQQIELLKMKKTLAVIQLGNGSRADAAKGQRPKITIEDDIQPKNNGGFSTKVDPVPPETKTVGVCVRYPLELRNKFYRVNGVSGSNCPSCGIFFEFGNSSHRC